VSLKDELLADQGPPERTPKRQQHPKGWEPGVVWNGRRGEVTTVADDEPTTWDDLIADWGLDPKTVTVVPGSVQIRAWDTNVGDGDVQRLRYYRATLVERTPTTDDADRVDVEALCQWVLKRPASKRLPPTDTPRAFCVFAADWQLAKSEGGGTEVAVERIAGAFDAAAQRIKELKRAGRPISHVYLFGMGDLIEQCSGHYAMQTFGVDMDRREQMRVARRLLLRAVERLAPLAERMVIAAVPGNHGENRNSDGKAYTSWTDNDDLAIVEQVGELVAANPDRYGHVSVYLSDGLTMTLDVCGVPLAIAHGHQAGGSGHAAQKLENWWRGQVMGRQGVADAQILVTGHLHHLVVSEATGRTFMQCPAMDGGSAWWTARTGNHSPAGMLTFGVGTSYGPRGWGDLAVL
jgi:predicted phosphodiesterase